MFENSLIESGKNSMMHKRGPWATVVSFVIEVALVCVLVLIPLIYTEALPGLQLTEYVVAPTPPPAPVQTAVTIVATQTERSSDIDNGRLKMPTTIPIRTVIIAEMEPPSAANANGWVVNSTGGPGNGRDMTASTFLPMINTRPVALPSIAVPPRAKVSEGVTKGLLIREVQPNYPPLARQARISGKVQIEAVIAKDGTIENLHVIAGHPMLVQSALEAVRQWRYKPYFLNGTPVEVETQITVVFTLAGS